jgi:hypothetical protein
MTDVFLVHHVNQISDDEEDIKLIGVFSSEKKARHAIDCARNLPGFSEVSNGFSINRYQIDKRAWPEGYITWAQAMDNSESDQ